MNPTDNKKMIADWVNAWIGICVYFAAGYLFPPVLMLPLSAPGLACLDLKYGLRSVLTLLPFALLFAFGIQGFISIAPALLAYNFLYAAMLVAIHRKKINPAPALLVQVLGMILMWMGFAAVFTPGNALQAEYLKQLTLYEAQLRPAFESARTVGQLESVMHAMRVLLPFFMVWISFLGALVMNELYRRHFIRHDIPVPHRRPLSEFYYPSSLILGTWVILGVIYLFFPPGSPLGDVAFSNTLSIFLYVYGIQGMAVIMRFVERLRWRPILGKLLIATILISDGALTLGIAGCVSVMFNVVRNKKSL